MKRILSCDWGTSSFRLRLVDAENGVVLHSHKSGQGIATTHALWKRSESDTESRISFYRAFIQGQIVLLESSAKQSLLGIPVLVSGMASSTIGMVELPYASCPAKLDGSALVTTKISATNQFSNDLFLISGLSTPDDVMRGEETMLVGCGSNPAVRDAVLIFPGTHSKHVVIAKGEIVGLRTFMTGELFDILSTKSILSSSIEKSNWTNGLRDAFSAGVQKGFAGNLLHEIFLVRTNAIFNKLSQVENYFYLSGIVIGSELSSLAQSNVKDVFLVSDELFGQLYSEAMSAIGKSKVRACTTIDADSMLVKGHLALYRRLAT